MNITRRHMMIGLAGAGVLGAGYTLAPTRSSAAESTFLDPVEAHKQALSGDILLIDIRRPDEWKRTGVGQGAIPIDMRRPDFIQAVSAAQTERGGLPVALICARGVRSRRMTFALVQANVGPIIDIPEGMLGSRAGPGWLQRKLPVTAWNG